MTNKKTNTPKDTEYFAKKTYREVVIWDWLARILPLTVLASLSVCYFFKWNTAIELILEVSIIGFFVVCFIWWYWALYKIAIAFKHIRASQDHFKQLKAEIAKFKKEMFQKP